MKLMRNPADLMAGLFLIGSALLFLWTGRALRAGTITQMGPGYTPNLLCYAQMLLGAGVLATAVLKDGEALEPWGWRPVLIVTSAVAFFAAAIEPLGLLTAVIGTVILSGFATHESRHGQNIILAILLAGFSALVFVKGLNLQVPIWPAGWGRA